MKSLTTLLMVSLCFLAAMNALAQSGSLSIGNSQNQEPENQQSQTPKSPTPSGVFASITSAPAQMIPAPKREQPADNSQSWNKWFWQNLTGILLVLVGIWTSYIALGTLAQIAEQTNSGTIAANAAMKSADVSSQDLEIANRAYLYLSEVRITFREPQNVYDETTRYDYDIVYPIYNGGQTPALYIGSLARTALTEDAPQQTSEAAIALDKPQSAVVPPRSREPLRPLYTSFVDKRGLDDIRAGKKKLFFYGMLVYRDIFDKKRHTRFTLSFSGTPATEGEFRHMVFVSGKGLNWFD